MHALRFTRHSRLVTTTRASPDCADDSGFFVDEQAARKMARDRRATRRPRRFNDILHPHENTVHFYNRQVSRTGKSRAGEIIKNGARNRNRTGTPCGEGFYVPCVYLFHHPGTDSSKKTCGFPNTQTSGKRMIIDEASAFRLHGMKPDTGLGPQASVPALLSPGWPTF